MWMEYILHMCIDVINWKPLQNYGIKQLNRVVLLTPSLIS